MKKKAKERILQKYVFIAILVVAILAYYFSSDSIRRLRFTVASVFFLVVAYPIGLLSPLLSILFTLFSFAVSLPILSTLYLMVAYTLSNIHYIIISIVVKGVLRRIPAYGRLEIKVRDSKQYKWLSKKLSKLSNEVGLVEPRKVRFLEMITCDYCERYITRGSKYCGFCGKEQWL
ncbi:MAG: hypothetical protein V1921_04510 [Candidatus Altiarchaeota archaeon]